MEKYYAFRKMMGFLEDNADVLDANMNGTGDTMRLTGEDDDHIIEIALTIRNKEENGNA